MRNLPRDDNEYDLLLGRIVKGADFLENPIIKSEDYDNWIRLYDEMIKIARHYRTGGK